MPPVLPGLDPIAPMLAVPGLLPTGPGWGFEFKYDGVRALCYASSGLVRVLSRNGNDVTGTYPELAEAAPLPPGRRVILDGEIVALEAADGPSFARLQQRIHVAQPAATLLTAVPVVYYVFDLLHLDGQDLTGLPYAARRDLLDGLGLSGEHMRVPARFVDVDPRTVLQAADVAGLEGVVAKRLASPYRPGRAVRGLDKGPH